MALRTKVGTLLFDRPILAWPLLLSAAVPSARARWCDFRNRGERLLRSGSGPGYEFGWQWASKLTIVREWPSSGRRLLSMALADRPIRFVPLSGAAAVVSERPQITFVVGHRGEERLPHLFATLESLLAQERVRLEIVVVEQETRSRLERLLPSAIRLVHTPPPRPEMPYSRAWAFNVGARAARGEILVLHDNDSLAPACYGEEISKACSAGYDGGRFQRFFFYLDRRSTQRVFEERTLEKSIPFEVVQNSEGGTLAIRRDAYERIGGHDESFLGWGGEDNEFFDRCRLLRFSRRAFLPFVHLEHGRQPGARSNAATKELLTSLLAVPAGERVTRLRARSWGLVQGPCGDAVRSA